MGSQGAVRQTVHQPTPGKAAGLLLRRDAQGIDAWEGPVGWDRRQEQPPMITIRVGPFPTDHLMG